MYKQSSMSPKLQLGHRRKHGPGHLAELRLHLIPCLQECKLGCQFCGLISFKLHWTAFVGTAANGEPQGISKTSWEMTLQWKWLVQATELGAASSVRYALQREIMDACGKICTKRCKCMCGVDVTALHVMGYFLPICASFLEIRTGWRVHL